MKTRGAISAALLAFAALALATAATGQEPPRPSQPPGTPPTDAGPPGWAFDFAASLYLFPDRGGIAQPTLRADRGRLHLESRYNYEAEESLSLFAGANFEFGSRVKLAVVPMLGGLVGEMDAVVPALELDLTAGPFELYSEGEVVLDVEDTSGSFLYVWSELSWWGTDWLRVGVVGQRTRLYQADRDISRGVLAGVTWKSATASLYWFNPGEDDWVTVVSVGLSF